MDHYYAKGVRHKWEYLDGAGGLEGDASVFVTARTTETLYTGGKAQMGRQNLFSLTAGATEYSGKPEGAPWSDTPSKPVPPTAIEVGGKALGWDSRAYLALPDNMTKVVTAQVKGAKHYSAGVGASKHRLVHLTQCRALTNPNDERTTVGVGEYVGFSFWPILEMTFPEQPWWITSGGSVDPAVGSSTLFTAPSNAATAMVRVFVRDVQLDTTFKVLAPSGVDHAVVSFRGEKPVGAGMDLKVFMAPLTVSFCRVDLMEVPGPGSNPSGYFTTNPIPPHNTAAGAGQWYHLGEDNSWDDIARLYEWPFNRVGGFDWVIPVVWKIGDGDLNNLPAWTQRLESNGYKEKVTKFGHCADQTPMESISQDCGN